MLLRAAAAVLLGIGAPLGEKLDGRIRSDAIFRGDGLAVLGLSIDLGNFDTFFVRKGGGKKLPGRSKALAVYKLLAANWG